jgi:hypothetical protein
MNQVAAERSSKAELTVFGCALKSPPLWREVAWICAFILVCVVGLKLIPALEQRGYFAWAAHLPVRVVGLVFFAVLVSFHLVVIFLVQRRTKKFRRPAYVPLLSGYTGPPSARNVRVCSGNPTTLPLYQEQRVRSLQLHSVVPAILLFPIAGMYIAAMLAVFASRLFAPGTNPDNWWTVGAMMFSIPISMYLYLVVYTRILIRRKGPHRAMRFMFSNAVRGDMSVIDRICIKLLGLTPFLASLHRHEPVVHS